MASMEEKIKENAKPLLEPGEEIVAAFVAAPRGHTQSVAGVRAVGNRQQGKVRSAAEEAGIVIDPPMAVALTPTRLLTIKVSQGLGMGMGGGKVKEILSSVPLTDVDSIEVSRLALGTTVLLTIRGAAVKLEAGAGAKTKELAEEFNRLKASSG